MAIAYDTSWNWWATTWTTHTWSHTCSWTDRILIVSHYNPQGTDNVTGVTYNWVAMTRIAFLNVTGVDSIWLYYLLNPSTGANNVVVTTSSSVTAYSDSTSYTWVGWLDTSVTNWPTSTTSMTTSITTWRDNCWLVWSFRSLSSSATAWTATTFRSWVNASMEIWDSNGAKTPAWSYSLIVNCSPATTMWHIVASIYPKLANTWNFFMFF